MASLKIVWKTDPLGQGGRPLIIRQRFDHRHAVMVLAVAVCGSTEMTVDFGDHNCPETTIEGEANLIELFRQGLEGAWPATNERGNAELEAFGGLALWQEKIREIRRISVSIELIP